MHNDPNSLVASVTNDEYAYTVRKTHRAVVTESRGEGELKTWVRVLEIAEGDVTVTIDLDSLAEILASKALCSAGGKSRALNGCVTATAANVQRKQEEL